MKRSDLLRHLHVHGCSRELSQAYFWTREWQAAEAEAEGDIRAGRVKRFASAKELFEDLDA